MWGRGGVFFFNLGIFFTSIKSKSRPGVNANTCACCMTPSRRKNVGTLHCTAVFPTYNYFESRCD